MQLQVQTSMSARPSRTPSGPPIEGAETLRSMIRSARGVFCRPLRIERRQGQLCVALEDESGTPPADGSLQAVATAPETQASLMLQDLRAHLDRCTNSRTAMPHLAAVEHGMRRRGMRSFDELPLPLLQRASGQVQASTEEPMPEGLALLQARLDMSIVSREEIAQALRKKTRDAPSSFFVEHKLRVSEASMTDFLLAGGEPAAASGRD